jgi:hypothetical protein
LRFVGLTLPLKMTMVQAPVPPHKVLFDLPSYCYDVHTRVGLKMLHRLVQGIKGAEAIRQFFLRSATCYWRSSLAHVGRSTKPEGVRGVTAGSSAFRRR